jgi:tight adherence protein C
VAPVISGLAVFNYTSAFYSTEIPAQMRLAAVFLGLIAGIYFPGLMISNLIARRQKSIKLAWSDALDLLLICVESGMGIEPALQRVSREIGSQSVPLAEELTLTHAELSYLPDRRKAFENLAKRTGLATVKSVVASLIQSERYGTPLGQALRVLAQENRDARMQEAERKAAALPPKLTVPMILFFLPVIFIIILGPSAILVMDLRD